MIRRLAVLFLLLATSPLQADEPSLLADLDPEEIRQRLTEISSDAQARDSAQGFATQGLRALDATDGQRGPQADRMRAIATAALLAAERSLALEQERVRLRAMLRRIEETRARASAARSALEAALSEQARLDEASTVTPPPEVSEPESAP